MNSRLIKELVIASLALILVSAMWLLWRRHTVYRKQLPRIYELRDLLPDPPPASAYLRDLDRSLADIPQKLFQFRRIEQDLAGLDPQAWMFLKLELKPLLVAKHPKRGWQALFDKLNEAKAYNYLRGVGYDDVRFIPRSKTKGQRTPDFSAANGQSKALCEVKTINASEVEVDRRDSGGVGTTTNQLEQGFFAKLSADLSSAKSQMLAYDIDVATKKIVYVILNFDDQLHEYADRYRQQIDHYLSSATPEGLEVVLESKPPFYGAMS